VISRSTIEQLNIKAEITDKIIQRIMNLLNEFFKRFPFIMIFDHLKRIRDRAGKLLERIFTKNIKYIKKNMRQKN
jgi:hypothetical protein